MNAAIASRAARRELERRPQFPGHLTQPVTLRDGTQVVIRPIRASDTRLELEFIRGLSAESRYNRFFSTRDLLPGELHRLTHIDYDHEMALIATTLGDAGEEEIGVARYVRDKDSAGDAEFAIVIADDWQRQGLGGFCSAH
jgi:acetyltransferase